MMSRRQITKHDGSPSFSNHQLTNMITSAFVSEECTPSTRSDTNTFYSEELKPDSGVLTQCRSSQKICVPDASSSIGGRCHDRTIFSTKSRQPSQRHLQMNDFICPKTCPEDLCACAESTELGYPDPQDCASELNDVCTSGDTSQCFNKEYLQIYEQTYCEFATCWLGGNRYEECACAFYQNYCNLYGEYADGYPEIAQKCTVASCCEQAIDNAAKIRCIPSMMPSVKPSTSPTTTAAPSESPTKEPTDDSTWPPSRGPTANPTGVPSNSPTTPPTAYPTISPVPNDPPTKSPSKAQTEEPTESPTTLPIDLPTESPVHATSNSPTYLPSKAPTKEPTESPTAMLTIPPTKGPSGSPPKQPTESPVEMPTDQPTSSPTQMPILKLSASAMATSPPTSRPTSEPFESDSKKGSSTIVSSGSKESLNAPPEFEANAHVQKGRAALLMIAFVGVGAFWLFL